MLTLPPAPRRAALLDALEALAIEAGPDRLLLQPVAPERLASALSTRGVTYLSSVTFRAAGMEEPEVIVMGGSGAATAFRTHGKAVVRVGADLPASAAIASVVRAAGTIWRQASELHPAASEEDDLATSVHLSLGAAEASAAHDLGERERAEGLIFLLAAQSLARDDATRTAAVASDLREPLDALYEDALRLLALRGKELRSRFRVDEANLPFERVLVPLIGSPPEGDAEHASPVPVANLDEAYHRLAAQPCPCGGRWRVAEQRPDAGDPSSVRFTIACRVCLRWRRVTWRLGPQR